MEGTQRERMWNVIQIWMTNLNDYPGWTEWKHKQIGHTLCFDDPFSEPGEKLEDFEFSNEIEKQHVVILQYIELEDTINSLKECEFYFRRYPFRGLPVTRNSYITNVCEMYFGRFYEFRERLKKYIAAVKTTAPAHGVDFGILIKQFDKVFDQELRARNGIHHHRRFADIAIDRVFLTGSISTGRDDKGWKREHLSAYRKLASEWAERVQRRGKTMDEFLEVIAAVTLANCSFLEVSRSGDPKVVSTGSSK